MKIQILLNISRITLITMCLVSNVYGTQPVFDASAATDRAAKFSWEKIQQANELSELVQHTGSLKSAVQHLKSQINLIQNQLEAVTINLSRAAGFESMLEQFFENYNLVTAGFDVFKNLETDEDLDPRKVADLSVLLNQLFAPNDVKDRFRYDQVRRAYKQRAHKGALESAELIINNMQDRSQEIVREVVKINQTNHLKDSVDIVGRLMGEMLAEQQKTNLLLAQLVRANSSEKFTGLVMDAKISDKTYDDLIRYRTHAPKKPSDNILPSGARGYDPFERSKTKKRKKENWSPFLE